MWAKERRTSAPQVRLSNLTEKICAYSGIGVSFVDLSPTSWALNVLVRGPGVPAQKLRLHRLALCNHPFHGF